MSQLYLLNEHGDLYFLLQISDHCIVGNNQGKFKKNYVNFYFQGITLMARERTVFQLCLSSLPFGRGFAFKFKPKLSDTTVNLLSPCDLKDKLNQRNSKNAFFR